MRELNHNAFTNCGRAAPIRGYLRPYLFDAQPKNTHPSEPPRYISALTHDFWESVNGPVGSGESFDASTNKLADGHPNTAPNPICRILTKLVKFLISFNFNILSLPNYITVTGQCSKELISNIT